MFVYTLFFTSQVSSPMLLLNGITSLILSPKVVKCAHLHYVLFSLKCPHPSLFLHIQVIFSSLRLFPLSFNISKNLLRYGLHKSRRLKISTLVALSKYNFYLFLWHPMVSWFELLYARTCSIRVSYNIIHTHGSSSLHVGISIPKCIYCS